MQISARDRRRLRRALTRAKERAAGSEGSGELNIIPFLDITVNLMLFLLATTAVTLTTVEVHARMPPLSPGRHHGERPERLSATVTPAGVILGTGEAFAAPGCTGVAPRGTIAVPATAGHAVDVDALRACAARIHAAMPERNEVVLTADPEIGYEEIVRAMDALRADGPTPLFPEVILSAGVR